MSYLDSQLMWKKNYPLEHEATEERLKMIKRRKAFKDLTLEQYRGFLAGSNEKNALLEAYEMYDDETPRGQFLNWMFEKRLKDGRII